MEKQKKQSLVAAPGGKSYLVPFILITSLFLLWGFAHGLLDVLPVRLLAVMDMSKHPHPAIPYYVYKFFILCELKGGSFTETFDILGKGFFRLEELPPLSLERVLPEQIQRMYAYYKHPGEDVYLD